MTDKEHIKFYIELIKKLSEANGMISGLSNSFFLEENGSEEAELILVNIKSLLDESIQDIETKFLEKIEDES